MNAKQFMILAIFITSVFAMPAMAFAQDDDDSSSSEDQQVGIYKNFRGGFGAAFADQGYGGQLLGSVFEMLLLQGLDLKDTEMSEGVFVLSAEKEETFEGNHTFEAGVDDYELHIIDDAYTEAVASDDNDMVYVEVQREGGFDYNLTVGAAITLLIWDNDGSFITAAQKVIDWASKMNEETNGGEKDPSQELITEGIAVLSWLLIHINDIFTGDELFVLNPITWQKLELRPWKVSDGDASDFNITKTRRYSNDQVLFDGDDRDLTGGEVNAINLTSIITGDSYTQWLFRDLDVADFVKTIWTQFSFDLAQLWVKNFHVEIDVGEIAKGEDANMADAFSGLDIEFYLFTHHLGGAFLYNDTNADNQITVNYTRVLNETDPGTPENPNYIKDPQGDDIWVPTQNEVTHQLILGEVNEFDFNSPKVDADGNVEWGLSVKDAEISPVPVGVDLNNYLDVKPDKLGEIKFGLKFIKEIADEPNDDGSYNANGRVKLTHVFAPWNNPGSPYSNSDVDGLDLAIVYISSIFHFHLQVDNTKEEVDPDDEYDVSKNYEKTEKELKVGNYLDENSKDKLDFVDLASDPYMISVDSNEDGDPDDATEYTPTTSIVPVALWTANGEKHATYEGDEDSEADDYKTDINAEASFNVLLYAVCYPEFGNQPGVGYGIWHDPTFSVYMVFTPESAGFWALILLIAGVGLVGLATVLIKRRKDNRY
ncbi:MAG: hypothetical protein ACTSR8_15495 [Promethearchaeota archaeon]